MTRPEPNCARGLLRLVALGLALSSCRKAEQTDAGETASGGAAPSGRGRAQTELRTPPPKEDAPEPVAAPRFSPDLPRPSELGPIDEELRKRSVKAQQSYLIGLLRVYERPDPEALQALEQVITQSEYLSFGNPEVSEPALTQAECLEQWVGRERPKMDESCEERNMVRVPASDLCVDAFEFPNVLCEYPVVWARANEAKSLCESLGKRLCDAHEWEGACAGSIRPSEEEYGYSRLPKGIGPEYRRARRILMEGWHNLARPLVWAYGRAKDHALCATGSRKSPGCNAVDYRHCGTNDYPAGSFPDCRTERGVFDQHGNVAEHMSFPLYPEELGGKGYTEMKGSWFLFAREETHPDDCRWRAKNWHTTKVNDPNSHRNYHLGFRCCADRPLPTD